MRLLTSLLTLAFVVSCAGCSNDRPAVAGEKSATAKIAAPVAAAMDESALRAAIATAIREQRLYAPAGNNAIELQLALRGRLPDDSALATALLELEPYAVIAAEQSLARREFDETRRLIGLIERANADASALPRLRDQLVAQVAKAEADADRAAAELVQAAAALAEKTASAKAEAPAPATIANATPTPLSVAKSVANSEFVPPVSPSIASPAPAAPSGASVAVATTRVPALLRDRAPRYPTMALRRKIEGRVELAFTIKGDGSVADVRVLSAAPQGFFEEAAIATTRQWQFEALGRDVATRRSVNFSLPKPVP